MKKLFTLILLLSTAVTVYGQEPLTFRYRHDVPVSTPAGELAAPWSGGFNTPQFSTIDLDKDGQQDLFVFDRQLNKVFTWLAVQESGKWQYRYAPEYEVFFPADLEYWVLLRDYNCDGLQDIFTSSPLGIRVFKQEQVAGGQLKFALAEEALFYNENQVNMQMNSADVPGIVDMDGDGDLDILFPEFSQGYTLELYRNTQAEEGLACGTLAFEQQTSWWGKITECDGCNNYLFNAYCRVAAPLHTGHSGSSILLLDLNADGDKDLVMGGVQCENLVLMENEGDATNALMRSFSPVFPATNPVAMPLYPAAFYEDVTFDGVPDMLVAPQATQDLVNINFENATWLYRNAGAADQPDFEYVQDDFLQGQMIDESEGAFPAFADLDADGDLDLLLGNRTAYRAGVYGASLSFYRNTGTATAPAFELVTDDYLSLRSRQLVNLKPAFADMNADGATDLVLTFGEKKANTARVVYLPNKSAKGQAVAFSFAEAQEVQALRDGDSPAFADVDKDGDLDMLLGRSDGSLAFYRNTGNAASPAYVLENRGLGGLGVDFSRRNLSPAIADIDGDEAFDLLVVDDSGQLRVYRNFTKDLSGTFTAEAELLENDLTEGLQVSRFGRGLSLAVAPLGGEGKLYITVGTQAGGLFLLEQTGGNLSNPAGPTEGLTLSVYPNPADRSSSVGVRIKATEPVTLHLYDTIGRLVYKAPGVFGKEHGLPLQQFKAGMYIIRATSKSGEHASKKIIIR
ncbi:putative secreted protein (Por secretion system target) [Pontibacter ummariensis]|uniref:Por secretion system C-terminal sorting domain-containing protein n=1 Tax=Pontibacter ummariensis TaxID=1610492 RepID=A0A239IHS1_9BACT|nr:T9SS type A sorting domain-containing protein [Pontibacter ummariensis]PRY09855.1 putative secreted protein (Por secretion system target) [Pontibacter ummariensis]SNS93105.1 Por secretion system C-terminal sorting domain-containing protein [Pontibacter ummariensis]